MNYFSIDGTTKDCFVLFHGTGGNEFSLLQIVGDLNVEASILTFEGDVNEGSARRFFNPLVNGSIDRADLTARVQAFLQLWATMDTAKFERLTFVGYSNGANFILSLLEQVPQIADRVVLLHPSNLNYTFDGQHIAELHLTTGAMDTIAVAEDVMQLKKQLQQHFSSVTLKILDGTHAVSQQEIDYLKTVL